jgi:hypothetical protein
MGDNPSNWANRHACPHAASGRHRARAPRGRSRPRRYSGRGHGRFYELGTGNIDDGLSACAEGLAILDPGMGHVHGRERLRQYLETFKRAMPDARARLSPVNLGRAVVDPCETSE